MLLTLTLREVERATPRAAIVRLALGGRRFDYAAGQAVLVGRAGQADRRPYSLATSPSECRERDELELLVGLDTLDQPGPHLGTLTTGMSIDVEGPLGSFTFPSAATEHRFLFVAGGTGIAPLRAMLHEALARPAPTQIALIYSARTPQEFAYGPELRALAASGRLTLWQTVTREAEAHWDGAAGTHRARAPAVDAPRRRDVVFPLRTARVGPSDLAAARAIGNLAGSRARRRMEIECGVRSAECGVKVRMTSFAISPGSAGTRLRSLKSAPQLRLSCSHNVVSSVDHQDLAGDRLARWTEQERRGVGDFGRLHGASHRRFVAIHLQDAREAPDA